MRLSSKSVRARLLIGASAAVLALGSGAAAMAQDREPISISPQSLTTALQQFGSQTATQVMFTPALVAAKKTAGVSAVADEQLAMAQLLQGTGLTFRREGNTYLIESADPQSGGAAGDGADNGTVQALIVTAQKREEDIQDVPIAISAFTQEDLTRSQVAGGPDLITQVPNMTFTKTNFSSYSIQLRGIGTQAISATTDPAVAVAFNNTPFIRNRFFEQEFYDLQRVEVLRGPQGTLYGRNATAGVVNIISQKPKFNYEAKLSGDVSNFNSSRLEGMANIPLVEDIAALRIAGAWTKRDGYSTNELTGNQIDGRDLWSTRVSLRVAPTSRLDANLIWEHFQEDDDRLRSGKQLCKKDVVTEVAGFTVGEQEWLPNTGQGGLLSTAGANLSQGCERNSLYSPDSFQTPNGLMLPYYVPLSSIFLPAALGDPYANKTQSPDLRVIESAVDPIYKAKADLGELQVSYDLTDNLTLNSETAYGTDSVYSMQDFNRFNTAAGAWRPDAPYVQRGILSPDGVFCDPQLGCSDRLVAVDVSTAQSWQFSQEFRLGSDFDGPFNFSIGANYLRADSEDKYYVFINSLSLIAAWFGGNTGTPYVGGVTDNTDCLPNGYQVGDPNGVYSVTACTYIDPNPVGSVNDQGHNYFLSKNPYKLISYAVFGEAYYKLTEDLKITAGLRWTVDKKEAPRVPTWLLASGTVGYPVAEVIEQEWREPTGRLAVDWKPHLSFTDETLLYGSYAHGYKAGGANPPGFVRAYFADASAAQTNSNTSATKPRTFDPEFLDAFELGAKNTLAGGALTLNLAAFYYDYKDYQISEIVDRSAFNRNFDAKVWGLEVETNWRPLENLRLGLKGGYEKTRIGDGEQAIDLMDRTAGDPNWTLVRPFPTFASSCIVPTWLLVGNAFGGSPNNPEPVLLGGIAGGNPGACEYAYGAGVDPVSRAPFSPNPTGGAVGVTHLNPINYAAWSTDINDYPGWPTSVPFTGSQRYPGWDPATAPNGGEGIMKPLGGNELPNAPHFTATVTSDYTLPLANDWLMTLHSDVHWQSQSWWRVFNDHAYDKLHPYFTMNLAAIFTNEEAGWNIMAYVKNVTDETAITGAFLNSDDTGLTTNVFLTEPRLYGLRVTKNWTGGPLLGGFGARHEGPYPLTIELGGQIQRHDAPTAYLDPSFADQFQGPLAIFDDAQAQDLDWGDGREAKVTWRPSGGPWAIMGGVRVGKANGQARPSVEVHSPVCAFGGGFASFCTSLADDPTYGLFTRYDVPNHAYTSVYDREEHELLDFGVGRDMQLGWLSESNVQLGLRYAKFKSNTEANLRGVPDWYIPTGFYYPGANTTHTVYDIDATARREFKGAGPVLTWDAARSLRDLGTAGRLDLDWSLSGGVLFGDQDTEISTSQRSRFYRISGFEIFYARFLAQRQSPDTVTVPTPVSIQRNNSETVPTATAKLGLTYKVGGFKVGAGYRWERYFNAVDGGFEEHKSYDRTFDGPYFKIAVGFGG